MSLPYSILLLCRSPPLGYWGWTRIPDRFSFPFPLKLFFTWSLQAPCWYPGCCLSRTCSLGQRLDSDPACAPPWIEVSPELHQLQQAVAIWGMALSEVGRSDLRLILNLVSLLILVVRVWSSLEWVLQILPGFHRGAVQARYLLPQTRALLQRGDQLITSWKRTKGKDKNC